MDVTQATQSTSTAAAPQTEQSSSSLTANSDFETFLKLLTAQMENQDPLKPLESTEFVAQLASFSAVEQQILTNTRLSDISSALTSSQASKAADWLGTQVLSPSAAKYTGSPIDVSWDASPNASRTNLEISNQSGTKIASVNIPIGQTDFSWDGKLDDGTDAPNGNYLFKINHYEADEFINSATGKTYSEVLEVQIGTTGLQLILDSETSVNVDHVESIRSQI